MYSVLFMVITILLSNSYVKIGMTYNQWLIVTAICIIIFVIYFIAGFFMKGKKEDQNNSAENDAVKK